MLPRWTAAGEDPGPGYGQIDAWVPEDVTEALRRLTADLPAVLLAAHVKVLAELSSEARVITGCRTDQRSFRCAVTVVDGPWRRLIADAAAACAQAATEPDPAAESTIDLSGVDGAVPDAGDPGPQVMLRVSYVGEPGGMRLHLRHRRRDMNADFAERVAGYHLEALRLMAADPDAPHHVQSLLSARETHTQLHGLCGPRKPLGDRLFVELFEEQARLRPDDVAAVHRDRSWTYRQLNERANQVAHLLLGRGVEAEDAVAVVLERDLDWLAATIGVFKSGGVYLPVRPDFPADRVARQMERSACRYAVTATGAEAMLDDATAQLTRACAAMRVDDAYRESTSTANPAVPIGAGQLAYIYFTSGSTGAPKGAMCEHAGMLNHLLMKVEDMMLGPGDAVTQTASQCFDISLWQVAAPLLVGGRTAIVDTAAQLDVNSFIDQIAGGGIQVIQIVPSYLDVLLSRLEVDHRPLGDLRSVSVTGEALKLDLVRRWFRLYPSITLVNAYGATEVSDDTMHEVLAGPPRRHFVAVGRSLRNVNTYILDRRLRLVPLGAMGEIAFSGVCVGRGYVNDPERTAQAFVEDPYRPGARLYRTGDYGRWLPEGTIEFLGRRDDQVKIRGFRVEIGEIESTLLRMPGVRAAAAVMSGSSDDTRHLVAFFCGSAELQTEDLRDFLAASVPDYMIPSHFERLDHLPYTENGKVDKPALVARAGRQSSGAAYVPPATATERKLATAWAETLNVLVGRIGRGDDFFGLGGTSLAAVRLIVKLDRIISLRQLAAHPVLSDLAALIDENGNGATAPAGSQPPPSTDLLQRLSAFPGRPLASLVCFPYAGGNAVNFQLVAKELDPARIAVYGVELPGHDLAVPDEPMADVAEIGSGVYQQMRRDVSGPVLLWGHCAGAAYALEVARLLEADGSGPAKVFLGSMLLDDCKTLAQEMDALSALSNSDIAAQLHQASAYIELDALKSERAELVGMAYRHDVCTTNAHLIEVQQDRARPPLCTPVDVVVAADDPTVAGYEQHYRRWERLAGTVRLEKLSGGGHYFIRTAPAEVAALVAASVPAVSARGPVR